MINISRTYFYINVSELSSIEFEKYSTQLFDDWEEFTAEHLHLSDYALSLEVEEGSIKALKNISVAAGILYIAIGQYGSFISGIEAIHDQTKAVSNYFCRRAEDPFLMSGRKPRVRKSGEALSGFEKLFVKVQKRQLSVNEAMQEAKKLLGDEANEVPEFIKEFQLSLENAPLYHKQLKLPLEFNLFEAEDPFMFPKVPRKKKIPTQSQPLAPQNHLRVQVWRESKKSKKNVRVYKL